MVNNPKVLQSSVAPHEDGALFIRAKSGDADAFSVLLDRYQPMLRKLAASFDNVPETEREDLYQEGLIAFYKAVQFYDPKVSSFSTFAYLCARRDMLSALKKFSRTARHLSFEEIETEPVDPVQGPELEIIDRENCELLLQKCDDALSEYEYNVLKYVLGGKRIPEIAALIGKDVKSAENALTRARKKLSFLLS